MSDDTVYDLYERRDEMMLEVVNEFNDFKETGTVQSWDVIKAVPLIREWKYCAETGQTHEKLIDKFQEICIKNTLKLDINSVLMGHSAESPFGLIETYTPENWTEADYEAYLDDYDIFCCWRISDYACAKLYPLVAKLMEVDDYKTKLYLIDMILSVTHQQSDLALWFVEGGSVTLSQLFEGE